MRLDVLIATCDRADELAAAVDDVVNQAGPDDRVYIVDQSEPATHRANRRRIAAMCDSRIRLIRDQPGGGLPRARNVALLHSDAPLVVFLDDDVRLLPGCIDGHRLALLRDSVGGVAGRIVEQSVEANSWRTRNDIAPGGRVRTNLTGLRSMPIGSVKGANMSFRKAALRSVGDFDEGYEGTAFLEDADISERLRRGGWQLWFEPSAAAVHLSAPRGGVRQPDALATERWRFHNTGYFVGRHRGAWGAARCVATFSLIAAKRAALAGSTSVAVDLMSALGRGLRKGA